MQSKQLYFTWDIILLLFIYRKNYVPTSNYVSQTRRPKARISVYKDCIQVVHRTTLYQGPKVTKEETYVEKVDIKSFAGCFGPFFNVQRYSFDSTFPLKQWHLCTTEIEPIKLTQSELRRRRKKAYKGTQKFPQMDYKNGRKEFL